MSDYTIKNFIDDVEDSAVRLDVGGSLQARFARGPIESEQVGVSHLRLAPNFRAPFGLEMIAVGNDRPEGGDGEMVQDCWKD